MDTIKWALGLLAICLVAIGCRSPISIQGHSFTITELRESTAREIESEIKKDGINIKITKREPSGGSIFGEEIADYTYQVVDPNYTHKDMVRVTRRITNPKRDDPVAIESTMVEQRYGSVAGEGTSNVRLRVEATEGAQAFYKKTGLPLQLRPSRGQQSIEFDYLRRRREEYVDIYLIPQHADPDFKPRTFLRISLSHPYETRRLPWDPWYVRFWNSVKSIFGKKN